VAVEFGPPGSELSQGDLIEEVPSVYIEDLGYAVKFADKPPKFKLQARRPEHIKPNSEHQANATEVRSAAVVLTHDCEIDKDDTNRAIVLAALVRSLSDIRDKDRDGIRQYTRHRAFYLPENNYLDGEHYIDLRRLTTIRRDNLEELKRLASMNEDGRLMLREHLFRFFARRVLPETWQEWETEE